MSSHHQSCDCSRCVASIDFIQEIIDHPLMFSDLNTRENLFQNRMEQEIRVEQSLSSAVGHVIEGMQFQGDHEYRILENTEVNSVLLGIFTRYANGIKAFSAIEFQIALHAWLVAVHYSIPPLSWSSFLIDIMQEFVPISYWSEIRRIFQRFGSHIQPLAEKLVVQLLIDLGIPDIIRELRDEYPYGYFKKEWGYTRFHAEGVTIMRRSQCPDPIIKREDDDSNRIDPLTREESNREIEHPVSRPFPDELSLLRSRVSQLEQAVHGALPDSPFNIHAEATERLFLLGHHANVTHDRLLMLFQSVQEMIMILQNFDHRIRALEEKGRESRE
ncbi:hypothetical protein N7451_005488 [Penicillium sp. IBT 35674x]|nr:hypothetical protein N7451_005488 [Penicillium sp. IBT 35674x]